MKDGNAYNPLCKCKECTGTGLGWISVKDSLPKEGETVDIYIAEYDERWINYSYFKDYNGQKHNNFFDPVNGGINCVTNATHWMYSPNAPKLGDN